MSVVKLSEGLYEVRWREEGRQKTKRIHGAYDLARKVLRKKLSTRDENRHLDVKKEINYRMTELIDRYWTHYGIKKASADREKSIVEGIRSELGRKFVREVDGIAVQRWYENLTGIRGLADNTASDEAHCVDRRINGDALNRDSPTPVVRRDVQRRAVGSSGKAEEWQGALRPHAVGAGRGSSAVPCGDRSGQDFSAEGGTDEPASATGRKF